MTGAEALEVDAVVGAVDEEVDGLGADAVGYGGAVRTRRLVAVVGLVALVCLGAWVGAGGAGVGAEVVAHEADDDVVDGVTEHEQGGVGLEVEAEGLGRGGGKLAGGDGAALGGVEGVGLGLLQPGHVERDGLVRRGVGGGFRNEGGEALAEVAQVGRGGGVFREVGDEEPVKAGLAEEGAEAGVILIEAVEEAEPVLAVVDFEPFEGGEAVVGLDEILDERGGIGSPWLAGAHAVGFGQRGHDHAGDLALEGGQGSFQWEVFSFQTLGEVGSRIAEVGSFSPGGLWGGMLARFHFDGSMCGCGVSAVPWGMSGDAER